ncbi:MAG: hypothetical protein R3Y06_05230 [Faecalibacterium sp.]
MLQEERKKLSTVTMFISFDLVNCTLYKSRYKGKWASGVSSVIDYILTALNESPVEGYQFWKVLGDEVVYTKSIHSIPEIADILDDVYAAVVDINKKIKSAQIGDAQTAKILAVKATIWIADISPSHLSADNIAVQYKVGNGEVRNEYLGTDIDGGFRIAKYTSADRVVLSADLAALFLKEQTLQKSFHKINFVAYRLLKGIWNGEAYPIFMYHGDENVSFAQSIRNMTDIKNDILVEYLEQVTDRVVGGQYHSYEEQLLTELYGDTPRSIEVEQLVGIITRDKQ